MCNKPAIHNTKTNESVWLCEKCQMPVDAPIDASSKITIKGSIGLDQKVTINPHPTEQELRDEIFSSVIEYSDINAREITDSIYKLFLSHLEAYKERVRVEISETFIDFGNPYGIEHPKHEKYDEIQRHLENVEDTILSLPILSLNKNLHGK